MITRLKICEFRNISKLELNLSSNMNILLGRNGQGKTSLLEAIFFLGVLRSFRTSQLRELQRIGQSTFSLEAELSGKKQWTQQLQLRYGKQRQLMINGAKVYTTADFIGEFRVVAFIPEDIRIINGSSSLRRRFMDMTLAVSDPAYLHALQNYQEVLKNRNALLKLRGNDNSAVIRAFHPVMAVAGSHIIAKREKFIQQIERYMQELVTRITEAGTKLEINYINQIKTDSAEAFQDKLEQYIEKDIQRGFTQYGPHLDDFEININYKNMRYFGSSGQCRMAALCLKMATVSWFSNRDKNEKKELIVLVDDVSGELDSPSREAFYRTVQVADQAFFTFTELPPEYSGVLAESQLFQVKDGAVSGS